MSLLMQALRKAERAKQNHVPEQELTKPSEALDDVLELAPQESAGRQSAAREPAGREEAARGPSDGQPYADRLTLSPLDAPAPAHVPPFEPRFEPGFEPGSEPEPNQPEPVLEFVSQQPPAPAAGSASSAAYAAAAEHSRRPRNAAPPPRPRIKPAASAMQLSARTVRIAALSSVALIIAALFGYMYWNAVYGAGSSRHLPMVPMPGQNAEPGTDPEPAADPGAMPGQPGSAGTIAAAPVDPAMSSPTMGGQAYVPHANLAPTSASMTPAPPSSSRDQMHPDDYLLKGTPSMPAAPAAPAAPAPAALTEAAPPGNAAAAPAQTPALERSRRAAPPAAEAPIRVARASTPARVSSAVATGFSAYQRGDMALARQSYQAMLQQDGNNRDALLGMAAVAVRDGQAEQAASFYARLLDIDPNDSDALAGLTGVRTGNASQSEARLKRVLDRSPEAAPVLFALGNLYARQGRWAEAQQQYFRAVSAAPSNADYAFNLAVGLDRLNQGKLAQTYYQRALELSAAGPVSFDRNAATLRARELGGP